MSPVARPGELPVLPNPIIKTSLWLYRPTKKNYAPASFQGFCKQLQRRPKSRTHKTHTERKKKVATIRVNPNYNRNYQQNNLLLTQFSRCQTENKSLLPFHTSCPAYEFKARGPGRTLVRVPTPKGSRVVKICDFHLEMILLFMHKRYWL